MSERVDNPATGESILFVSAAPELLVMDATWSRPGHRTVEHLHPSMSETFTVTHGRIALRVDGRDHELAEGQSLVVAPGRPHLAWNPTDGPVSVRLEMQPALRWEQFVRRLFDGEDPLPLLADFAAEVRLPS